MFTTRPDPASSIDGKAACRHTSGARRLTAANGSVEITSAGSTMPALLTSRVTGRPLQNAPSAACVASTSDRSSSITSSALSCSGGMRSTTATRRPSAFSLLVTAAPIPRAPPVTIAKSSIGSVFERNGFVDRFPDETTGRFALFLGDMGNKTGRARDNRKAAHQLDRDIHVSQQGRRGTCRVDGDVALELGIHRRRQRAQRLQMAWILTFRLADLQQLERARIIGLV